MDHRASRTLSRAMALGLGLLLPVPVWARPGRVLLRIIPLYLSLGTVKKVVLRVLGSLILLAIRRNLTRVSRLVSLVGTIVLFSIQRWALHWCREEVASLRLLLIMVALLGMTTSLAELGKSGVRMGVRSVYRTVPGVEKS